MARRQRRTRRSSYKRGRGLAALDEAAHIGRLYIGRCVPAGKDACARIVSVKGARRVAESIARSMGGSATVFPARGIWKERGRPGTREPTLVVETITAA